MSVLKFLAAPVFLAAMAAFLYTMWLPQFNPKTLVGKNVIVTGGSTGIGREVALWYCQFGSNVVITARRKALLEQTIEDCRAVGHANGTYKYISADMIDFMSAELVIEFAKKELGGIDVLVLNHIIPQAPQKWDHSHEMLSRMDTQLEVNFRSYVHLASHAYPELKETNGSIVVVSRGARVAGLAGMPYLEGYSASKFALNGFFGGLREEYILRKINISVTLCFLGFIATDSALEGMKNYQKVLDVTQPSDPKETALEIVKGGASRYERVYHPYLSVKPMTILNALFPQLFNYINRYIWATDQ